MGGPPAGAVMVGSGVKVDVMRDALGGLAAQVLDTPWAALVVTDGCGTVLAWNRAAEDLYGWRAEEVVGRSVTELTVAPDDTALASEIMAKLAAGETWEGDFRVRRRDGSTFVAHVRDAPILDERGHVVALVGWSVDVAAPPLASTALADASRHLDVSVGRLARLQALTAALSGALTLDEVANVILGEAAGDLGAGSAGLWLLDEGGEALVLVREAGFRPGTADRDTQLPLDAEVPGTLAVKAAEPVLVSSLADRDERWPALRGTPSAMEAIAVLPLVVEGQPIGTLAFGFPEARDFDDGEVRFFSAVAAQCAIAVDRARLHQAERVLRDRVEYSADATALLTERVDRWEIVRRLSELAVPALADWCSVFVPTGGALERVALVGEGVDESVVDVLNEHPLQVGSDHPVSQAFRTGEAQVVAEVSDDLLDTSLPVDALRERARQLGVRAGLALPLATREGVFGVLSLTFSDPRRVHDSATRTLAEEIAHRAAIAVQNALVSEREHGVVTSLRRALFPPDLPVVAGVDLVTRYMPASDAVDIGGDWWDAFERPDGRLGLAIGDVGGHGEAVAAAMAELRNALRAYALDGYRPRDVVGRVSEFARRSETAHFTTVIYVDLDPSTGTVRWASAGHPPALVLAGGEPRFLEGVKQPALGLVPFDYTDDELVLGPRDCLFLYSDGLVEGRTRDIDQGLQTLADAASAAPPGDLAALAAAVEWIVPHEREDDITFLAAARA